MLGKKDKDLIWKVTLQNAVDYNGRASIGSVIGKVMAENTAMRKKAKDISAEAAKSVAKVNKMALEEQKKELEKSGYVKKVKKKRKGLPPLKGAKRGKVVTRFAPAPTGPLTIFHILRAASLSYMYAKRYDGKFILRLEDTDPEKVEKEFYDMIEQDLRRVNIKPDKVIRESDHMSEYYDYMEQMINDGNAYVCTCSAEKFRELKRNKKECPCRNRGKKKNIEMWKGMLEGVYKPGQIVARLKTSMKEPNPVLRDPPLFRISKGNHPFQRRKYNAWPLYNFANVIEDHKSGLTHVFRGKEHEHNTAVQELLYKYFGWNPPITVNFGMVYLPGDKLHTRDIKQGIKSGKYTGWDDPRLPTVRAFLRRGFMPETFKKVSEACGLSKTDIRLGWENIEGINRKIIDSEANRYMVVLDPVKIKIDGLEKKETEIPYHPDFPKRGKRKVKINGIFISGNDFKKFNGKEIRLINIGNIKLGTTSRYMGELKMSMQKIQWVSGPGIKVKILTPEGELTGIGEDALKKLKVGDIIQMIRIGFARVDSVGKEIVLIWAHK